MYLGDYQRSIGSVGAGHRFLHVGPHGDLHACPFCRRPNGNALADSIGEAVREMKKAGCHEFETNSWV